MHFSHEDIKFWAELLCQSGNKVDKNTGGWLEDDDDEEPGMPASKPDTGDGDRRGVDPEWGWIISEEASASNVDPFQHKQEDSGQRLSLQLAYLTMFIQQHRCLMCEDPGNKPLTLEMFPLQTKILSPAKNPSPVGIAIG
jgi:hypothetical protein